MKKPTSPPGFWDKRHLFLDKETGDVYIKGEYVPELHKLVTEENIKDIKALEALIEKVDPKYHENINAWIENQSKKQGVVKKEEAPKKDASQILLEKMEAMEAEINRMKEEKQISQRYEGSAFDEDKFAKSFIKAQNEERSDDFMKQVVDIDPDDYIENGVTFSSMGTRFLLVGDKRMNQYVNSPYKRAFDFTLHMTEKKQQGKEELINNFCSVIVYSKKEVEWLRNHTLFNIEFWETIHEAIKNEDAQKAQIAARHSANLSKLQSPQIIRKCTEMGIQKVNDIGIMRSRLAAKMAEEEMSQQNNRAENRLRDSHEAYNVFNQ